MKLTELGMLCNQNYKICFVLDKTSMFKLDSGAVKPLHLIWAKYSDLWSKKNTLAVDDLARNFVMNIENGIVVTGFYRAKVGEEIRIASPVVYGSSFNTRNIVSSSFGGIAPLGSLGSTSNTSTTTPNAVDRSSARSSSSAAFTEISGLVTDLDSNTALTVLTEADTTREDGAFSDDTDIQRNTQRHTTDLLSVDVELLYLAR